MFFVSCKGLVLLWRFFETIEEEDRNLRLTLGAIFILSLLLEVGLNNLQLFRCCYGLISGAELPLRHVVVLAFLLGLCLACCELLLLLLLLLPLIGLSAAESART